MRASEALASFFERGMSKTKPKASFPALYRRSDRSFLLLALLFSVVFGVAICLGTFGKRATEDISQSFVPRSFAELKLRAMVFGHPIARMVPYILGQDREVATFLVAIAKKESNWGKFAPERDGKTCYNYWGYRGPEDPTDSGYSCFASPGEAVLVVGARLRELLDQGFDTPRELVVWKRGFLNTPLDASEEKWVSDVAYYAEKLGSKGSEE